MEHLVRQMGIERHIGPERFKAFYREHGEMTLRFFLKRTYDAHLSLELTAETFAAAFAGRGKYRGKTSEEATGWLFAIARNQLSQYHRRGQVQRRALDALGLQVPSYSEGDLERAHELIAFEQQHSNLSEHLQKLPVEQRNALSLRIVDELPYPEVARRLGVKEPTARARVSRGLAALRTTVSRPTEA